MSNIAYCGLDCCKCEGFLATQSCCQKELSQVAKKWSKQFHSKIEPADVLCDGCKTGKRKSSHCQYSCEIRKCCLAKNLENCLTCTAYPCKQLLFIFENAPEARENLESFRPPSPKNQVS